MTNHYQILGIPNYSSAAVIRKAYIVQIKKYHPDLNSSQEAVEICKRINVAKEALETTDKKSRYDRRLKWYLSPKSTTTSSESQTTNRNYRKAKRHYASPISNAERTKRDIARRKAHLLAEYAKGLKEISIEVRYILCALYGLLTWFIMKIALTNTTYELGILSTIMMSGFFFHSVTIFIKEYYKYHDYIGRSTPLDFDLDKRTRLMVYVLFLGGFSLAYAFKYIHLISD